MSRQKNKLRKDEKMIQTTRWRNLLASPILRAILTALCVAGAAASLLLFAEQSRSLIIDLGERFIPSRWAVNTWHRHLLTGGVISLFACLSVLALMYSKPFFKHDYALPLVLFFSVASLIFIQSWFLGAYISPDSTNYLRAAQAIRNGYGFYVNTEAGDASTWFSIWPIGYPALIALVSLLTNTEIYLASKILSVVLLAIIYLLLYCRFKKTAWIYALVTLNYGFLQIFWFTWSEQPFILGLIWLSLAVSDTIKAERITWLHAFSIGLSALFLFFSRYIGAFSVGVIGLLVLYYLYTGIARRNREHTRKAVFLCITAAFVSTVIIVYLYINYTKSGYATGTARVRLSILEVLICFPQLFRAQIQEMRNVFYAFIDIKYVASFCLYALCALFAFKLFRQWKGKYYAHIPVAGFSFLAIGLLYWCSIVAMRFSSRFDSFSYRLLFPASALCLLGVVSLITHNHGDWITNKTSKPLTRSLMSIAVILSLFSHIVSDWANVDFKSGNIRGYTEIRGDIINDFIQVPALSVIISAGREENIYFNFIRPDLLRVSADSLLSGNKTFSSLLEQHEHIYVYAVDDWIHEKVYEPLLPIFSQYRDSGKKLIKIK
jgi:hypothetical protein